MGLLDGYPFDSRFYGDAGPPGGLLGMLIKNMPDLPMPQAAGGFPALNLPPTDVSAASVQPQAQPQQAPDQGLLGDIGSALGSLFSPSQANAGPMQQAPQGASPGLLDHLTSAWQGFGHGGLTSALGGLITGQRQDPQGVLERALVNNGASPDMARAAATNPQFLQMAAPTLLAAPQQHATMQALVNAGVPPAVAQAAALNPEILKTIAPQLYTKPEFKTVKNALGEDVPIFANADKQSITYPTVNGGQGGQGSPQQFGTLQKSFDQIESARNSGAGPDQLIQMVPPSLQSGVKAMLGGQAIPSNLSNRGSARDTTIKFAHAIDPNFDETGIPARVALRKSYEGGGKNFQETLALNTVSGHLNTLKDAAEGLDNSGFKPWNMLKNAATDATVGNPALVKFRNALVTTQNELAKAYHGGHVSDAAFNAFNNSINEAQTPAELKAAIGQLSTLLGSKISANEDAYRTGTNGLQLPSQYRALNDEARHSFEKIDKWVNGGQQPQQSQQPQQQSSGAPVKVTTQAEWSKLPKGTQYVAPDGTLRTKQ